MNFPNVERRESGSAWQDKTSDAYYAPESEVTADRTAWADDMWGVELSTKQEQQLRGWE